MRSEDDLVISVRNVTKAYRLFTHPGDRIKQFFSLGLKRYYKNFSALQDVSFDIRPGETVGIIGSNGAGKSTLLQIVCGILKPTSGTVEVRGRVSALLELGAGFNPEFTGEENIYFQGMLMGLTREQVHARYAAIIAFADIGDFIAQPVRTYSSGMFVRLAFAVAIHVDPDILVVDEALGVGDALFTQKCYRFLHEFRKNGTLVLVSHDLSTVSSLCDRVLWLDKGRVRSFGTSKNVNEDYLSFMFGDVRNNLQDSPPLTDWADQRLPYLNASNLRNDLRLFQFDPIAPSFGTARAIIINTLMLNELQQPCNWVIGGEIVTISIQAHVIDNLNSPIIGFHVKDFSGQKLFGDNTFLSYSENPVNAMAGTFLEGNFKFRMPRLPLGEYSICVAIANGSQGSHETLHWIHDAVRFESCRSSVTGVAIGLPMQAISLLLKDGSTVNSKQSASQ